MNNLTEKFNKFKAIIWLGMFMLSIGCTTNQIPTPTIAPGDDIPVTRPTSTSTVAPNQTATQPSPTQTPISLATVIPEPSQTPTNIPWQAPTTDRFLIYDGFYEGLITVFLFQPEDTSFLLSEGLLIDGHALSTDNTYLVFDPDGSTRSIQDRPNQLALMNLITGETATLQLLARPSRVFWAKDNMSFLYPLIVGTEGDQEFQIVSYDIESGQNDIVLRFPKQSSERWSWQGLSQSGRYHAFIIKKEEQWDVYTYDTEATTLTQVTNSPDVEVEVLWSPVTDQLFVRTNNQGEQWAFAHPPYISQGLMIVDADGNNSIILGSDYIVSTVGWSNDGQRLAYINDRVLCLLDIASGIELCPLQNSPFREKYTESAESTLVWSNNNTMLTFHAYPIEGNPCPELLLLDLEGNSVSEIDQLTCGASPIYWSK